MGCCSLSITKSDERGISESVWLSARKCWQCALTLSVQHDSRPLAVVVRLPAKREVRAEPVDDEAFLEALRAGLPAAQALLFERHGRHVRRVVARLLGTDADVGDVVHDVFLVVFKSIHLLKEATAMRAWLSQVAVYGVRNHIRRRARWRAVFSPWDDAVAPTVPTPNLEATESMRAFYRVLDKLGAEQRIAFALRYVEGMALAEVAEACRVSVPTIKRRLTRAQTRFASLARREPALAPWVGSASAPSVCPVPPRQTFA